MKIRKFRISIPTFIQCYLPPRWRVAFRSGGYAALLTPFSTLMSEYITWRNDAIIRSNVTVETVSLTWFLNYLFDPTLKRISIDTNDGAGVPMGLRATEVASKVPMGLRATEAASKKAMPLRGEHPTMGFATFAVYLPASLNSLQPAIRAELNKYRFGGKQFVFINN